MRGGDLPADGGGAYRYLVTKATLLVEHFQVDMLTVGEEVPLQIDRASKVHVELGV